MERSRKVKVKILRGNVFQEYTVEAEEGMSVMDLLERIYDELDNTLAFFRHEACHQEACGKCLVKVNGRVCLACGREVKEDELCLEPYNDRVIRDLVCEVK